MKKHFRILISLLTLGLLFGINTVVIAQPFPGDTPPGPPVKGGGGNQGAPIGDGVFVLSALALAYGSRKLYVMHKATPAEE